MLKIHNERTQCLNMSDEHMFLGHNPILNKDKNKKNIFKLIRRDISLGFFSLSLSLSLLNNSCLVGCLCSLMDLKSNSEAGKLTKMVQEQHPFFKQ